MPRVLHLNTNETIHVLIREGIEDDAIDDAIHRRASPNSESQGTDRDRGNRLVPFQAAPTETEIAKEMFNPSGYVHGSSAVTSIIEKWRSHRLSGSPEAISLTHRRLRPCGACTCRAMEDKHFPATRAHVTGLQSGFRGARDESKSWVGNFHTPHPP